LRRQPPPAVGAPAAIFDIAVAPQPVIAQPNPWRCRREPTEEIAAHAYDARPIRPLSQRMGEQGTTALTCEIRCRWQAHKLFVVTRSSGSQRLDDARVFPRERPLDLATGDPRRQACARQDQLESSGI